MRTIGLSQLLQCLQNFAERILLNHFNEFIQKEKNLNNTYFGYQKHNKSTEAEALHLIEELQENYDRLKISVPLFIDLAKGFESISHEIFLKRLKRTVFQKVQLIYLLFFSKTDSSMLELLLFTKNGRKHRVRF